MDPLIDKDDAGPGYIAARETTMARSAGDALLDRVNALPPGGDQAPPTTPEQAQQQGEEPSVFRTVFDNVTEIPRGLAAGARDAAQETLNALTSLSDWAVSSARQSGRNDPVSLLLRAGGDMRDSLAEGGGVGSTDLPDVVDDPETATGKVAQSVGQLVAGMVPFLKVGKLAGMTGLARVEGAAAAAGATAFDPHEERLANLIQEVPALQNPVTEFLAADPEDTEAEGRMKAALESLGVGGLAVPLGGALRVIRGARRAGETPGKALSDYAALKEKHGEVTDEALTASLGDKADPLVKIEQAGKTTGKRTDRPGEVFVNFARIDSADDVKKLIGETANAYKGSIDDARRGVVSQEETQRLADELGYSVEDLLSRRKGQPFNAEEALAARRLWAASAEKLTEAAKKAADPNAGELDQFAFRRMLAVHHAVQAEVIGARTETARALASWRIPAGGGVERAQQIQALLDGAGGTGTAQQLARRLTILSEQGASPAAINQFARKSWGAASVDAVREFWVNALLSNPKTHLVNVSANALVAVQQALERGAAARIAAVSGGEVVPGEMGAMFYGMVSATGDAFRLAAKALRTGETGTALGKVDLPRDVAINGDYLREVGVNGLARGVDYLGEAVRVPSRLLGAEDEFFKTIGYRMELHAQALRQATGEGLKGPALRDRIVQLTTNPPENIRVQATDAALYSTFTNQAGAFGRSLLNLRERAPMATFVIPFVRTPVNIARYAFERSPLAPFVGQWRADMAAGGARADLALARVSTGTLTMMAVGDIADSGRISGFGPDDQGEREALMRQGWQPYSLKVGDKWVSYNRSDPIGMTFGLAADFSELVRRREIEPEEMDEISEIVGAGIAAVARTAVSKTYMSGIADFIEMMQDPERFAPNYLNRFAASFVPAGAAGIEQAVDPVARETVMTGDYIRARIAGLSESLPPRRDLWGKPITTESGMGTAYDALSPAKVTQIKDSPIDAEMQRLNTNILRISKRASFDGVDVNLRDFPGVYDAYVRLSGNDLKLETGDGEMGAKDYLDAVVSGNHTMSVIYDMLSDGEDGTRADFIADTINRYRRAARAQILNDPEFVEFQEYHAGLMTEKQMRGLPQ